MILRCKTERVRTLLAFFFCAITPGANESEAPGSIMPPDYFFARIAANSIVNHVDSSIVGSLKTAFINDQADVQYFRNSESKVRLVIFGHTHIPMMKSHINLQGEKCLYVNSGSWEDTKTRDKNASIDQDAINMHFVVIDPLGADKKTLQVSLYQYKYGTHSLEEVNVLDL